MRKRRRLIVIVSILVVLVVGGVFYSALETDWFVRDQIALVDSPDVRVRFNAAMNISLNLNRISFLTRKKAEAAIMRLLDDPNVLVRGAAASGLHDKDLQPFVKQASSKLSELCFAEESQPRVFAAHVLFVHGPFPPLADRVEIERLLGSSDIGDRRRGMLEIVRHGSTATPYLRKVAEMTTDSDSAIRDVAFVVLSASKPVEQEVTAIVSARYDALPANHPFREEYKNRNKPRSLKAP